MKVVVLAGGFGTRISEESHLKPKPMVEIGDMPILWHIMKYYSSFGFNEFVICLGYKQYVIKEFFAEYFLHTSDVTINLKNNEMKVLNKKGEDWSVTLIDTGLNTMTGGRIKRVLDYIPEDDFFLTYGDGLSNVDLNKLLEFHKNHKKIATITTVSISSMKGVLDISNDNVVTSFREKEASDEAIINGGYMVLNKKIGNYIKGDEIALEKEPFTTLATRSELMSFRHKGFWQCMDTQREMKLLNELWASGNAPWKIW
ncbi:MAG: glucose-1-phosphate cytidylyltransferase [Lachnospiraceae bacterium]|nr:glucose-1-phosphate cytidylyltransferase [Lachnospiraceae bacterium]